MGPKERNRQAAFFISGGKTNFIQPFSAIRESPGEKQNQEKIQAELYTTDMRSSESGVGAKGTMYSPCSIAHGKCNRSKSGWI